VLPEFCIPGSQEKTSDFCNTVVSAEYCRDCGKVEARFYHCNDWGCPTCYFWTASRAAHRLEDRLTGVQRAYALIGKHPGRIMHVIFSVPESEYEDFDYKESRKSCIEFSKMIGVLGGSVIFHPFRVKKEYRKPLFDALKAAGLPGGIWRGIHEDILSLGSWREYVFFAPHFHVLGFYPRVVLKSNKFFELTGWTYKAVGVAQDRNIYRTARYVLTHHAVLPGHAAVYFGIASYSKTSVESLRVTSFKRCPKCGSEDYYLVSCSEFMFSRYLEGLKPSDESLLLHVRVVKNVKKYKVRLKQVVFPVVAVNA